MNQFIRVSNDIILNISSIFSICRSAMRSPEYDQWNEQYNALLQDVVEQYIITNIEKFENESPDDKIANELRNKFAPFVKKNLTDSIGECPKPFNTYYIIKLHDGTEMSITEEIFDRLAKIINIDMSEEIDNYYMNDECDE